MTSTGLSPIELFLLAGNVGRTVILLLAAASIWCWVLIIEGVVGVVRFKAALRKWRRDEPHTMFAPIQTACAAATRLRLPGESVGETRQRVMEAMNRAARPVITSIEGGLSNLAVIASVSPFVGLFGTVWGIMASFTAIAASKDTSLAVVAPGIAEALATTAIGLAAAIPASIGYTRIGASIGAATQILAGMIEEEALAAVIPAAKHPVLKEVG